MAFQLGRQTLKLPEKQVDKTPNGFQETFKFMTTIHDMGDNISTWSGYDTIDSLYFIYLLKKYKVFCFTRTAPPKFKSYKTLSYIHNSTLVVPATKLTKEDSSILREYFLRYCQKLIPCFRKDSNSPRKDVDIIPIRITLIVKPKTSGGHANIAFIRLRENIVEFVEPHGKYMGSTKYDNITIAKHFKLFVECLNQVVASKKVEHNFSTVLPNEVCPEPHGFQTLESWSKLKKERKESGGYCVLWSLLITELSLLNPTITAREIIRRILSSTKTQQSMNDYMRYVARGYSNYIDSKITKYFSIVFDVKLTLKDLLAIIKRHKKAKISSSHFYVMWNAYIDLESYIITNPHKSMQQVRQDVYNNESEICKNSSYKIQMRMILDKIMNHKQFDALSPVLVDHRKMRQQLMDSLSAGKDKQTTKKVKNPLPSKTKKSVMLDKVKTILKQKKVCPPGKVLNEKTNRCNKVKPSKTVKRQMLVRKECPPGSIRNPKTGRCNKVKPSKTMKRQMLVRKECPPGSIRNPKTGRCNKVKPSKTVKRQMLVRKECPPGSIRNPKTGRCNKVKPSKTVKRQMLVRKECPPGKARNPNTGRCKIIK